MTNPTKEKTTMKFPVDEIAIARDLVDASHPAGPIVMRAKDLDAIIEFALEARRLMSNMVVTP